MSGLLAMRAKSSGFTLVELLLAVTLMSILLGLAYGGLRAATRATESGQALLEESGSIRIAHQFIRRQLNQMQPLPFDVAIDAEQSRIVFEGDSQRIQFVGPMPGYLGEGGPQVQVLELVSGPDGTQYLMFSHALLQGFEPQYLLEREPILLLDDIESGTFEFLGRDENGELKAWAPRWDQPDVLPVVVTLDLEFSEEHPVVWPLLASSVKTDESALEAGGGVDNYRDMIQQLINESARPRR